MPSSKNGFTIIELLVAISIIAVLSVVGMVMYSNVQKSARTAKRIGDLRAVKDALETYKTATGAYPVAGAWTVANGCGQWTQVAPNQVIPGLVPNYMQAVPTDPGMNNTSLSCYLYYSNGTDYKFLVHAVADYANPRDYTMQPLLVDPARDGGADPCKVDYSEANPGIWSWSIYTEGFKCV